MKILQWEKYQILFAIMQTAKTNQEICPSKNFHLNCTSLTYFNSKYIINMHYFHCILTLNFIWLVHNCSRNWKRIMQKNIYIYIYIVSNSLSYCVKLIMRLCNKNISHNNAVSILMLNVFRARMRTLKTRRDTRG